MESFRKVRSQRKNVHSCTIFWGSRSDPLGECRIKKVFSWKKNIKRSFHSTIPRLCLTYLFLLSQLRLKNVC